MLSGRNSMVEMFSLMDNNYGLLQATGIGVSIGNKRQSLTVISLRAQQAETLSSWLRSAEDFNNILTSFAYNSKYLLTTLTLPVNCIHDSTGECGEGWIRHNNTKNIYSGICLVDQINLS